MKVFLSINKRKIIIILVYLTFVLFLYFKGYIPTDISIIRDQLSNIENALLWYFIISTLRILFFLPSTIFIIVGGLIFNPWVTFGISMLSYLLAQTIIYYFTRVFFNVSRVQKFISKNKRIMYLLETYQIKLLALGFASPFTPSDLLTSASAILGIKYRKLIITIFLSSIPLTFLYSFIGFQLTNDANLNLILMIIFAFVFSILSYHMYRTISKDKNKI